MTLETDVNTSSGFDLALELDQRLAVVFDGDLYTRSISGTNVVVHCHHYNARLQNMVEASTAMDGTALIVETAETVFHDQLLRLFRHEDSDDAKWALAAGLYARLGYGALDFSDIESGRVVQTASHFVEGFAAAFPEVERPICSFATGFIQAAHRAITGRGVAVTETACMCSGAEACAFSVSEDRIAPFVPAQKSDVVVRPLSAELTPATSNIDEKTIIDALVGMPIVGNDAGLIPAFGVYLANTPADFYNLLSIRFVDESAKKHLETAAARQLIRVAEICGMNTFRGIITSPEWEGLVQPMVQEERDTLFGIVAVSNALGWGRWDVIEHTEDESLELRSTTGYESVGYREFRGQSPRGICWMYRGVAAGIMQLVYGEGTVMERFGQFVAQESACCAAGGEACTFLVEANE